MSSDVTPASLQRLRALHDAATPGEWRYVEGDNLFVTSERGLIFDIQPRSHGVDVPVHQRSANGRYVAELHNALPAILAALDRRAEGETCGTCRFWDADSLAMGYCGKGVITPRMLSADERTRFGCTLHEPAPPSGGPQ